MNILVTILIFGISVFGGAAANHIIAAKLYRELEKVDKGNLLFSPFSLEIVLALLHDGARGETSEQLGRILNLAKHDEDAQPQYKNIIEHLNNITKGYDLSTADKIYPSKGFKINPEYAKLAKNGYKAEIEDLDFSSPQAVDTINSWVEKQTHGKIKNLVTENDLKNAEAIVINALYLNANWTKKFRKQLTGPKKFYSADNSSTDVQTMSNSASYEYGACGYFKAQFLKLPYKGENLSMTIALPFERDGLSNLEKNLEEVYEFNRFSSSLVSVSLPKFTIQTSIKFVPILQKLGVTDVFSSEKADLSKIGSGKLFVSNILQKAFINVTEDGTEAAAATSGNIDATSVLVKQVEFKADHPFIFWIKLNDEIIFTGRVSNPKSQ